MSEGWFPYVMKRWNSTLDRKTCVVCRDHDGETVPVGTDFHMDDEPGAIHPCCRCVQTLILLPIPIGELLEEGESE